VKSFADRFVDFSPIPGPSGCCLNQVPFVSSQGEDDRLSCTDEREGRHGLAQHLNRAQSGEPSSEQFVHRYAMKAHMATLDVNYPVELCPGTEHGFVFPERYCFSSEGAETHYERLAELFNRTLG
jgi:dienelactone hydrolase